MGPLSCSNFDLGPTPPLLRALRVVNLAMPGGSIALDADLEFAGEASITLCTRIDLRQTQFLKMWEEKYGDGSPAASDAASDAELGGDDLLMADDGPAVTAGADVSSGSLGMRSDSSSRSGSVPAGGRDASVDSEGDEAAVAAALLAASDLEESEEGGWGGREGAVKESGSINSSSSGGGGGGAKASTSAAGGKKKSLMNRVRGMMKNMAASLNQVREEGSCGVSVTAGVQMP